MTGEEHPDQTLSIEEMVRRFEALANEVLRATTEVPFDLNDPQQATTMALHGTQLELAHGITELIKLGDATCAPILLRSLLEASVDQRNLVKDPDYLKDMKATWLKEQLRLGKTAKEASGNPYLKSLSAHATLKEGIAEKENQLKELKASGHKPLTVRERFKRAGAEDLYVSVYWDLCTRSHSGLNALEGRHVQQTDEGHRLVCFRNPTPEEVQRYLDPSAQVLAQSLALVTQLVEAEVNGLEDVRRALIHLRALYPDPEPGSSKSDPASAGGASGDSLGRKPQERDPA